VPALHHQRRHILYSSRGTRNQCDSSFTVYSGLTKASAVTATFKKNKPSWARGWKESSIEIILLTSNYLQLLLTEFETFRMCKTPSKTQTDRHQESNLMQFSLEMWNLVAITSLIFLIIDWPNFVYLLVDLGFLSPPPLNSYEASRSVPPISDGRPWQTQWTNGQTNKQMDVSLCPFVLFVSCLTL